MRVPFFLIVPLLLMAVDAQVPQKNCTKAITFAVAGNGSLAYRLPNVSHKWFDKAEKKFPNVCFTQDSTHASTNAEQYLVVLSTQSSAFNGLFPSYHTTTNTTTNPVSGNGTATGSQGSSWAYTYQGTVTSTTTTTQETNLPYTDTTLRLFANAYDKNGNQIGSAYRSESSRQGGDAANTLGYNLGARLGAIHLKEHLLDEIVDRVSTVPSATPPTNAIVKAQSSSTSSGEQSPGNDGELWIHAGNGIHNIETFAASRSIPLPRIDDVASRGTVKCIIDSQSSDCIDNWPVGQKAFAWMLELGAAIREAKGSGDSLLETVSQDLTPLWTNIKNVYCRESPGAAYTNLDNSLALCPSKPAQ